jgi:hypothetical protein
MGYRSEIKAAFYTKKVDEWPMLRLFIDENFPQDLKGDLEVIGSTVYSGYVFSVENWKWYDSYPQVQAFNAFVGAYMELLGREDAPPWAYEFIRIGEDTEDIETKNAGNADYLLQVRREIVSDF